ncbi:FkbM family methyltransferase [Flavobacterium sp.]|uniref:FkbM family methyltransferase n=1 Tax=Flavobacterium sp. TaxID=239 RepID=UPI001210DCFF|nr:FkbM family methyltransferase [Flavobacterium sp.]RZJ70850.1 MAG: FkbM family methyltransferase [Flavobacterium sp.]
MGLLRKTALKILKTTAFDTAITHHFTKRKFFLNSYNHKGYWYYGANREGDTISIFQKWVKPGDYVLEIGGHIGYFTTFYANIAGKAGKVDVFEPSEKNAKYLVKNVAALPDGIRENVTLVAKGAGDSNTVLDFYIDPISGQNNSFVKDFDGFLSTRENSAEAQAETKIESIEVITLDSYFEGKDRLPNFVKIDVEGFEWNVLKGFAETIAKAKPKVMVEIQANAKEILEFFISNGYTVYNDKLEKIADYSQYATKRSPNIFFSHD